MYNRLTGRRSHYVVGLSVCPFVCNQTCERNILKTNELILMKIGTSVLRRKRMKRSTLGVKRSKVKVKVKVTRGRRLIWRHGRDIILDKLESSSFSMFYNSIGKCRPVAIILSYLHTEMSWTNAHQLLPV